METPKPMGMQKKDYHEAQQLKAEEDFKYHTNQRIQNLQFAIDMINKSLAQSIADQGSLEVDCSTQMKEVMSATMNSLKDFRQELGDISSQLKNSNDWIKQIRSDVEECVETSDFNEKISHMHDAIKRLHIEKDAMRKEFNGLLNRQNVEFEAKLKSLKEDILAIPSEIPNIRKVFDQKIELVELNGQNAVLRSSNNEKQIMLVERKIDNLYQLIKRLEIANQESHEPSRNN